MSDDLERREQIRRGLGARLGYLRKRAQFSTQEVGDALGVSSQTIRSWESGKHTPTADFLVAIADLFRVTVDYLIDRPGRRRRWFYDSALGDTQQESADVGDACWRRGKPFFDVDEHVRIVDDEERQSILDALAQRYRELGGPE